MRTYRNFGDQCLEAAGTRLWKSVPAGSIQMDIGYKQF